MLKTGTRQLMRAFKKRRSIYGSSASRGEQARSLKSSRKLHGRSVLKKAFGT